MHACRATCLPQPCLSEEGALTCWFGTTPQVDLVRLQSQRVLASMTTSSCQSEAVALPWSVAQTMGLLTARQQGRVSRALLQEPSAATMPQCWHDCMGAQSVPAEQVRRASSSQTPLSSGNATMRPAAELDSVVQSGRTQICRSGATASDHPPSSWSQ